MPLRIEANKHRAHRTPSDGLEAARDGAPVHSWWRERPWDRNPLYGSDLGSIPLSLANGTGVKSYAQPRVAESLIFKHKLEFAIHTPVAFITPSSSGANRGLILQADNGATLEMSVGRQRRTPPPPVQGSRDARVCASWPSDFLLLVALRPISPPQARIQIREITFLRSIGLHTSW
jgi:hypothetical protein